MRWVDALRPARMRRIAIVSPQEGLRAVLVALAAAGVMEIEASDATTRPAGSPAAAPRRAERPAGEATAHPTPLGSPSPEQEHAPRPGAADTGDLGGAAPVRLADVAVASVIPPEELSLVENAAPRVREGSAEIGEWERTARWDLLAGERELERVAGSALVHRGAAVLAGWTLQDEIPALSARLDPFGAAVVQLPSPPGRLVPTLITGTRASRPFRPLVDTYATVPYADVDPSIFAGAAYILMFGMMFGDVAHGLILAALGLYVRGSHRPLLAPFRKVWPIVFGAGLSAAAFGFFYGEAFGPTSLVPTLWLAPLEQPVELLVAGVVIGAALLTVTYVIGMVNRWREGGPLRALYASSGIAGACFYVGAIVTVGGVLGSVDVLARAGVAIAVVGLVLLFVGFVASTGGGAAGIVEAAVELVDAMVRTFSNAVSFARLAAFGLTHAALSGVVWAAAVALWALGGLGIAAAVAVFVVGNLLAFGLEALVAAVQSLRLEYYELFSRIFVEEGRRFLPWRVPVTDEEET